MLMRPASLQGRLLRLVLGLVAGVWLAMAVLTWFDVSHELDELLDGHLAQAASLLVAQQVREIGDDDHDMDTSSPHRYAPQVAFQVFHEGRLSLRSANAPVAAMVEPGGHFQSGFRTIALDGVTWRVFAAYGAQRDVQVYVGERVAARASIVWAVLRNTLWPMLVALPLLALAAWAGVRSGMAPLRRLGPLLAARQPQALYPVVVAGAPAEMTPMLEALNGLFGRIAELMENERRFTADAAHELRTPIAAIRAQAQVALTEVDDERRRHALHATLAGCDRASRLVEQLLTLSRLESGGTPVMDTVELGALARQVVVDLAPRAIEKGQTIELDAGAQCEVQGNATLLAVLLHNLVDNAIRYCPSGSTVKIAVSSSAQARLSVEDSGPAMSEHDLQRLGERFFRVLGSGASGSGLGWSIVRRIAAVHQAAVNVGRSSRLGGLAVELVWPA